MDPQNQNQTAVAPPVAPPPPAATPVETVPAAWPGAFGIYKYSKAAVRVNLGLIVVLVVLSWVIDIAFSVLLHQSSVLNTIVLNLISLILSAFVTIGCIRALVAGLHQQKISLGQSLSNSMPLFVKVILQEIAAGFLGMLSVLLFIIPAFFVLPRLALIHYYLIIENQGVIESIKSSWAATKGNVGKVYGIFGVMILMVLLMVTIIGIPFAVYFLVMYQAAYTVLYGYVKQNRGADLPTPPPATPYTPPVTPQVPPAPPTA